MPHSVAIRIGNKRRLDASYIEGFNSLRFATAYCVIEETTKRNAPMGLHHRNLANDTFDASSLNKQPSDVGFMSVPTASPTLAFGLGLILLLALVTSAFANCGSCN